MENYYNDNDILFNSNAVNFDVTKSARIHGHFYVKRDNGSRQAMDFVDLERLSYRLSEGMVRTLEKFNDSKYTKMKITLELE